MRKKRNMFMSYSAFQGSKTYMYKSNTDYKTHISKPSLNCPHMKICHAL